MSYGLKDISIKHLNEASKMMNEGKIQEASTNLKIAEETSLKAKAYDVFLFVQDRKEQLMYNLNAYDEALKIHSSTLKIIEGLLSKNPDNELYQSFLHNNLYAILSLGYFFYKMGRFTQAKNCFELQLFYYQKLLKKEPNNAEYQSSVAGALSNLGALLWNRECLEEAKQNYEKAIEIWNKLLIINPENIEFQSNIGGTLNNLGLVLSAMGQSEVAKQRYEKALEMKEKKLNTDPENVSYQSDVAMTLNNLGLLLFEMGRIVKAKQRYEEALEIYKRILINNPENVEFQAGGAMTLNNLGFLLINTGHFEEARQRLEKALEMREKLLRNNPGNVEYQFDVGRTLNNLGALFRIMGRFEEAKQSYEKALEIREKIFQADPENLANISDVGGTLNNLSVLLYNIGRIEEAKQRCEKALEIYEKKLKANPENTAYQSDVEMTLSNFGTMLFKMGRIEEAQQMYKRALEICEKLLKIDPKNVGYQRRVASKLNNLGVLHSYIGRIKDAKQSYDKALEIREKLFQADPENVAYQSEVGETIKNIGDFFYNQENYSTALDFYLRSLNEYALKSSNLNLMFKVNASIGNCYEKIGKYKCAFIYYEKSIECIESIRSHYFIEEIKIDIMWDKSKPFIDMISFLCTNMKDSEKAWEYLGRFKSRTFLDLIRFLDLQTPNNIPSKLLDQEEKLISSIKTLDRIIRKTEKADKIARLTREIKEKEAKLDEVYKCIKIFAPEYVDLRKGQPLDIKEIKDLIANQKKKTTFVEYFTTNEKVFIFFIRSDQKTAQVIEVDLTEKSLKTCVQKYLKSIENEGKIGETWEELSKYIIDPVFRYIKDCELVYIVPHGYLHYLPLHALCAEEKRLIEHFPILYAPSLTAIKYSQSRPAREFNSCLSLGYTQYEKEKIIFEGEAKLVADLFKVEPKIGLKATSMILEKADSDIIHISCHGGFDWRNPLSSGLKLADKNLTVNEIFDLDFSTNLLVLSACETGLNAQKPGDELIGLTRAFLYAGARSLVVTLWPIRAYSTFKFMESFYKKIKENGMNKAEALQQTQIEFIHDKQYSNPYLWAPFILIGDWK
jgi:CHAT domain-containing protein/Tfp pilus assembly protein PilF